MRYADHMWCALVGRSGQAELALRIGLARPDFLHALGEREQCDLVARSRLACGGIGHGTSDVLGGSETGESEEKSKSEEGAPRELKRLLKKSEEQIPRRLKPARDDKNKGFIGMTEVMP